MSPLTVAALAGIAYFIYKQRNQRVFNGEVDSSSNGTTSQTQSNTNQTTSDYQQRTDGRAPNGTDLQSTHEGGSHSDTPVGIHVPVGQQFTETSVEIPDYGSVTEPLTLDDLATMQANNGILPGYTVSTLPSAITTATPYGIKVPLNATIPNKTVTVKQSTGGFFPS